MIENYVKLLEFITKRIDIFFENQKEYIFCKKGCAKCCKNAQFPYSSIEVQYLLKGAIDLEEKVQEKIKGNILKILKEKEEFKGDIFLYDCPFLIDDKCSVYNYRGLVCRVFGLITQNPLNKEAKTKVPFCYKHNLNYSNVINKKTGKIDTVKFEKSGIKNEPLGYNLDYDFLTSENFEKSFELKFGEKKALIEWFNNFGK